MGELVLDKKGNEVVTTKQAENWVQLHWVLPYDSFFKTEKIRVTEAILKTKKKILQERNKQE